MIALGRWGGRGARAGREAAAGAPRLEPRPAAEAGGEESREARLAALSLAEQNADLRREAREAKEQSRRLAEALAAVRIEADLYKARLDPAGMDGAWRPDGVLEGELRVRAVEPDLRMVILDGGGHRGVLAGMRLAAH